MCFSSDKHNFQNKNIDIKHNWTDKLRECIGMHGKATLGIMKDKKLLLIIITIINAISTKNKHAAKLRIDDVICRFKKIKWRWQEAEVGHKDS